MDHPKVFYVLYDHQKPTGGQKKMYRHVDILNQNGFEAYALHQASCFRLSWFENQTRIIDLAKLKLIYRPERDFLVLPEDLGTRIETFPGRKIIFNQGVYNGFSCFRFDRPAVYPYLLPEVEGILAVSEHNIRRLRFAFPDLNIYRIIHSVDPDRFRYRDVKSKEPVIALVPKNRPDLAQVFHLLHARGDQGLNRLKSFRTVFVEGLTEAEVADLLEKSLLLVFLSTEEGWGLLPLEAMLAGSLVVAYHAGPLTEFLNATNALIAEKGDVEAIVKLIENAMDQFHGNFDRLSHLSREAENTARCYSPEQEAESVIKAWSAIMSR